MQQVEKFGFKKASFKWSPKQTGNVVERNCSYDWKSEWDFVAKNGIRCQFHQHFYVQIFCTNIVSAAFTTYMQLEKAAKMTFV